MPRKAIPKVPITKVVEILDNVIGDVKGAIALTNNKNDTAVKDALNLAIIRIEGLKNGIELVLSSPSSTTNGE